MNLNSEAHKIWLIKSLRSNQEEADGQEEES